MRARVAVPATVANLGPGFDVLALALDLESEVTAEQTGDAGIVLDCGEGAPPELLDPAVNLVARAYAATCAELGVPAGGVHLRCVNRIPFRRGLGSSAAATLGGVLCATALHAAPWDHHAILSFTADIEGHPDNVAAALLGGLAIVVPGAAAVSMPVRGDLAVVVLVPDVELETALARRVVAGAFTRDDAVFNMARCALLVRALASGDYGTLGVAMDDRWHQPPRSALFPALPDLVAAAVAAGARGAALAGAGPSVVALTDGDAGAVGAAMLEAARARGLGGRVLSGPVRNAGARVVTEA